MIEYIFADLSGKLNWDGHNQNGNVCEFQIEGMK